MSPRQFKKGVLLILTGLFILSFLFFKFLLQYSITSSVVLSAPTAILTSVILAIFFGWEIFNPKSKPYIDLEKQKDGSMSTVLDDKKG